MTAKIIITPEYSERRLRGKLSLYGRRISARSVKQR